MRILLVSQYFYPAWDYGGPVAAVTSIAKKLCASGHRVGVLTTSRPKGELARFSAEPDEVYLPGINVYRMRALFYYRGLSFNPGIPNFCRRHILHYDVVHLFGLYDFFGLMVYAASRIWSIPYVVEPLGMYVPAVRGHWRKQTYHALIGNQLLQHAAAIVATSEYEREQLESVPGLDISRVVVRPNGVEPEDVSGAVRRGGFRASHGLSESNRIVLFLGRIAPIKHLELLLEAFAGLPIPDARLLLVGPQPERGYVASLQSRAERLGVDDRISFHDTVSGLDKQELLADADVVVLSSHTESFGSAAAEAIMAGVPVVVTSGCGIAPLVRDRVGLVSDNSPEEFGQALLRLLTDEELYRKLSENCPKVSRELSWDGPMKVMEQTYARAVDLKSKGFQEMQQNVRPRH